MNSTIYALSTPNSKAALAVIRISGGSATDFFAHFSIAKIPEPRRASLLNLKVGLEIIDSSLVIYFKAPNSFTGEDVVEISCHGGRAVVKRILGELGKIENFRLAEAGEFTKRAFLNGKIDLLQAEAIADVIDAETSAQLAMANKILLGEASSHYVSLHSNIVEALAMFEAYIDFPEDEVPREAFLTGQNLISKSMADIESILSSAKSSEMLRDGIIVSIIGAPNAGKSSLLNMLAKRDAAIVSDIAGTTRDLIELHLDIAGYEFILTDTAGIRDAQDIIEKEGIRRTLEAAKKSDIVLALFDSTMPPDNETLKLLDERSIIIFSKADLSDKIAPELESLKSHPHYSISCKNGIGIDSIEKCLEGFAKDFIKTESIYITRARHSELLKAALESLKEAMREGIQPELRTEELRYAAYNIGKVTGRIDVEDILDRIFATFCIGK